MTEVVVDSDTDVSNITVTEGDVVKIESGATLKINEPIECKRIEIGQSNSKGHLRFYGNYDMNHQNPAIYFDGGDESGIKIYGGSLGVDEVRRMQLINLGYYMPVRGHKLWNITTDDSLNLRDDFYLVNPDEVGWLDMKPVLSFNDGNGNCVDLEFNCNLMEVGQEGSSSIVRKNIQGGDVVWSDFEFNEGDGYTLRGKARRYEDGDIFISRLKKIRKRYQSFAPPLLSYDSFVSYVYLEEVTSTFDNPALREFEISLFKVDE